MDDDFPYYPSTSATSRTKRKCRTQGQSLAAVPKRRQSRSGPGDPKKIRTQPITPKQQVHLPAAMIGQPLPGKPLQLPVAQSCTKCLAKRIASESRTFCCGDGTIVLPSNSYPVALSRLYTSPDPLSTHFRKYARLYNNLFAFSSIGGKTYADTQQGIYVFKLHGQIYHNVPDLVPTDGNPKYLQLYFYDGQHEAANRSGCFSDLDQNVIDILMNITQSNPYARFFRSLKNVNVTDNTQIRIQKNPTRDQRVSNVPTSDEVAVIWADDTTLGETSGPHILVTGRSQASHRIMHYYGCYDPLQYPLLFPCGECGWHQGLKKRIIQADTASTSHSSMTLALITNTASSSQGEMPLPSTFENAEGLLNAEEQRSSQRPGSQERNVSCREYYCYKLQNRPGNMLLRAGRCLQQYVVDMYVKLENTRLDYFRNNQDTIRSELYQGLLDTIDAGEQCAANVGRRVNLPATYIGGPRDMKRRYLNAMALVQRYGKPDFFITVTCNAGWPEIKRELAPGEEAQNRPDIVARVFRAKLLALKKKLVEDKIFGEVAAFVYVVEFQKRGLPHAHILLIMKPGSRMNCTSDFDKFVSAEIPPVTNVSLRTAVLKHMMHGPCGHLDPERQCMQHKSSKGRCKYAYPKQFADSTTNSSDGYPVYRRRKTEDSAKIRGEQLDNRWVIPYNPYLLDLFDCHLNVEVCSTIQAVKYLYKYVYKGHDKISFNIAAGDAVQVVDEIQSIPTTRVSSIEAMWRIYGFDLFEIHPPVMPLPIHLPSMQTIQLRPHENLTRVVSNEKRIRTPLTEFFKINNDNEHKATERYLYSQFTEHYRWDKTERTWFKRRNKLLVIARLVFVSPSEGERYFLRLLLNHVKSPKSFEDLKTVNGHCCSTYQEAALELRLIEEDNMVDLCLAEACNV
ncbi:uncharacterized protein LOC141588525 [Silene latifolia]|uniref:uncharacterized protein LOC141588525 n=1 Tax=Silene latifolia TaxID=37657 RepID=UPI003D77191F